MATGGGGYGSQDTNDSEVSANSVLVIQDQVNARNVGALPHNQLVISNASTACTLFIFFDDFSDDTKPTFVLFPQQQLFVPAKDQYKFETIFVKNTHATTALAVGELKWNVSTVERFN